MSSLEPLKHAWFLFLDFFKETVWHYSCVYVVEKNIIEMKVIELILLGIHSWTFEAKRFVKRC